MALWDQQVAAQSIKCPGCASNLIFDVKLDKMLCKSCGNVYKPGSLDLDSQIPMRDTGEADETESNKIEYACDSCGAVVVTDSNTSATFCSYCGSPTLVGRRLRNEFRPDAIIPFKITKKQAIKNIEEWIVTNKYRPNDLTKRINLDKITGLYVPFWLVDADCSADLSGQGYQKASDGYMSYSLHRIVDFQMSRVPFDGAKHIDNLLMKALEPFDYSEMVRYNDMYLPGFYAERFDESFFDITDRIAMRIDNYACEIGDKLSASEYDVVNFGKTHAISSNYKQLYALLPVWFIRYEYDGIYYTFAVNGQTGEAGGSLPFSEIKRKLRVGFEMIKWGLPLIIFTIMSLIIMIALANTVNDGRVLGYAALLLGAFFIAFLSYSIWAIKRVSFFATNPIDPPPPIENYINFSGKFKMVKDDMLVGFMEGEMPSKQVKNPSFWQLLVDVLKKMK